MARGEGMAGIFHILAFSYVVPYMPYMQKKLTQHPFLVFSLGCGIGYGYLHRIPTRAALPVSSRTRNVPEVMDNEKLPVSDHSPPSVAASTPSISEVDVGAVQHISTTSPTQPVADLGNQILFKKKPKQNTQTFFLNLLDHTNQNAHLSFA